MVAYRAPQQPAVQAGSVIMILRGSSAAANGRLPAGPLRHRQPRASPSQAAGVARGDLDRAGLFTLVAMPAWLGDRPSGAAAEGGLARLRAVQVTGPPVSGAGS